jgi:pyruvate dehydrogenase E2 component (dihydrolipoamide acetyltransferase)
MKEYTLPSLGADMDEGMLAAWLVEPGDTVARGQVIAEVETDKGIIEVEVWEDAVVSELLVEPGEARLSVGTPIARLTEVGHATDVDEPRDEAEPGHTSERAPEPVAVTTAAETHITPPVRHLAHQLGVDPELVAGSGPNGSVTRDDIRHAAGRHRHTGTTRTMVTPRARRLAAERGIDLATLRASRPDGLIVVADLDAAPEQPVAGPIAEEPTMPQVATDDPKQAMRRAIARSMERSKREIPHYYLSTTIDMASALGWLELENEDRPVTKRLLSAALLLKASALALARFPDLNGHWIDGAFHASESVHLGVAVSLRGGGLVAPAIHDADTLTLDEMMEALTDLVARARAGRLRGSEMSEQTCTVTNLGDRGVDSTFPVIIPPQVAIIGFGRLVDIPVAVDGGVTVHPVVTASLAGDHRVTDGHAGGLLLRDIDQRLQEPDQL